MFFDIVSDLHIDQWEPKFKIKHPCGKVSNYPFQFPKTNSDYLIIAGDVSDDIDLTVNYLNELSKYTHYKNILFVDGNHEHVNSYPNLISADNIYSKIKNLKNNKIIYLRKEPFRFKEVVIVGANGWWDYCNKDSKEIENCKNYFKEWIHDYKEKEATDFIDNVLHTADLEYHYLKYKLEVYSKDIDIKKIIVVTHSCPYITQIKHKNILSTIVNSKTQSFNTSYPKLSHWIFGHIHDTIETIENNIHFISNPRGRPEDLNRIKYNLKNFYI